MIILDKNEFLQQQLNLIKEKRDNPSIDWQDVNDFRVDSLKMVEAVDTTRKGSKILNEYLDAGWRILPPSDEIDFTETDNKLTSLKKERIKIQTEKLELNRNLREVARDELITEHIVEAIKSLDELPSPEIKYIDVDNNHRSYLLCIADAHYGIEFEIKDLFGNIVNAYSPEIFEQRMNILFNKVLDTIEKEQIKELNIFELGDSIENILRLNSQIMNLRYGIIESSILYAEYLATWLNELSSYVRIKYQSVTDSNHNQLRLLGMPKNAFPEENMEKVITSFLKERLKNNPNITIIENPTGMNYAQLSTYTILSVHGEKKNMSKAINDYSRALGVPIDYLIAGHKHHISSEEVGINSEVLNVGSLMGTNPYAMSLQRTASASASLFVFEQLNGKIMEYNYKL